MPATLQDEGIVLRRRAFGDADRILVLFTLGHGKISCLARGVRRARARNAAGLDLLARSQMLLVPGRNLFVLAQARPVGPAPSGDDAIRLACAAVLAEAADALLEDGHPDPELYSLLAAAAGRLLDRATDPRVELLLAVFELAAQLGYLPELELCVICGKPLRDLSSRFLPELGGVAQAGCAGGLGLACSAASLRVLRLLGRGGTGTARRLRWSPELLSEVEAIVVSHLEHRLDRRLRSVQVLEQLEIA